jgi:hypothetical protein
MLTATRKSRTPIHGRKNMMKKLIAVVVVATLALLLPALAVATEKHHSTPHVSGTITAWDDMAKQGTIKDAAGKETPFGWSEKTTVTGTPMVGEHASVSYTKDKDGKRWATHIKVGAKPATTMPPAPK